MRATPMDAVTRTPKTKAPSARRAAKAANRSGGGSMDALAAQAATAARMLKLLGNESRLLILCSLIAQGEMKVGDLVKAVGLSQSALSQHLALMRADGLVAFRRDAQTLYYRVRDQRAARIIKLLKDIYCGDL